jgi:hypothetical protein
MGDLMSNKSSFISHTVKPERAFNNAEDGVQTFYEYWADGKTCGHHHQDLKSFLEAHPNGINNLRIIKKNIH